MKHIQIISFVLFSFSAFSQRLPDKLDQRPDGIVIDYFDYSDQKNIISTEVFLGENLKFKLPKHNDTNRINIAHKTKEIEIIEKYLTFKTIENLNNCCSRKKCPDTFKGYFLMVKKGNEIIYTTIDLKFLTAELCGNENIEKIINSFLNI